MKSTGVESVHDERWRLREMLRLARSVRRRSPRHWRWLVPVLKQELRRKRLLVSRASWY